MVFSQEFAAAIDTRSGRACIEGTMNDPNRTAPPARGFLEKVREYLLTGLLAAIPLVVTWFVLQVLFGLLSAAGRPVAQVLAVSLRGVFPGIESEFVVDVLGVILVLAALLLLGWGTKDVFANQILHTVERTIQKIPLVAIIYGSVKKFIAVISQKPGASLQRVVLIDFPSSEMKTVGLVTRTMTDETTGEELVAVYVPTTPNPTSGYLEIVPRSRVVSTNWTVDEATTFIVSGGAVGRDSITYHDPARVPPRPTTPPERSFP